MSVITKDLGIASAYGYAKSKGYTGTEEEFAELMASYADVAQQAEAAAQDAEDAKDAAVSAKNDAVTAKTAAQAAQSAAETASGTATTKASEAAQSAQSAAGSASAAQTSATAASGSASTAQTAAQTATNKASEASSSASAASTAKTGAETARTGAQTAQANAEAAASSVSASAAQIEQNTEDIAGLKNEFLQFESGFTSIPLELTINPSTRFISQRFNISDYNFPLVFKCSDTAYSFYISFYYESGNPTTTTWQKNSYVLEQSALPSGTIAVGLTGKADDEHALSDAEKGVFSALETWSLVSVVNIVANVEYGKNLYNKDALTEGYLNPDGTIHADNGSGWMVSNFMPCLGEETYVFTFRQTNGSRATTSAFFVTEYDENRTVIKQTNQISHTITTSADAKWFRICNGPSARVDYMVNKGAGVTPYVDFQENTVINDDHITDIDYKNIAPNGISYKNIDSKITDIFAPIDFVEQTISYPNEGYVAHNGVVESYSNVYVSDLIDCRNIDAIHYTGKSFFAGRCVVFYDSKMFAISCVPSADQSGGLVLVDDTIVVPKNAVYMRLGDYSGGTSQAVTVSYSSAFKVMSSGWYDKKWVVVGDSLTEVNSRTTKHYFDYIKDETGINVVNMGISGTGYAKGSDNNYAFYQRIASVPADADVITIFGSFNDLSAGLDLGTWQDSGVTTLGGCINYTINTLLSTYPLANFGIVAPCPWQSTNPGNATAGGTLYCDLLKEICYKRGIPFLDLYHDSLLRPWDATFRELAYSKDDGNGVHPDENGHKLIAPRFRGFLDTLLL